MSQLCTRSEPMIRRAMFVSAAFLLAAGHVCVPSAWAQAQGQIFVTNYGADSVTVHELSAMGDAAPLSTILGQQGDGPHQIAIHRAARELVVANNQAYSVSVYDLTTGARKRTIAGPSTGLNRPTGVAVDEVNREIYVVNDYANSVTVYDILATGDAAPKRTITSTSLLHPAGIAVDLVHDEIVIANYDVNASSIATFDRSAVGESAPKRLIIGPGTRLERPQGFALDLVNDEILVASSDYPNPDRGAILVFHRTDSGHVGPFRILQGITTKLCNPMSVAVDYLTNEIVVANSNFGAGSCAQSVTTYDRMANDDTAPKRMIAGALTTLFYPASAAIFYGSSVTVKMQAISANVNAGANVGYNISATANGGAVLGLVLTDIVPGGLTWNLGGTAASSCTLSGDNLLRCFFGNLAKGETKAVQLTATSTSANCPGITNRAIASYNDGAALRTSESPLASITIKCKTK